MGECYTVILSSANFNKCSSNSIETQTKCSLPVRFIIIETLYNNYYRNMALNQGESSKVIFQASFSWYNGELS